MSEIFFRGIEIGMTKKASAWGLVGRGALLGGGIGGVAGAINSDPGSRMRGFMQGAAVGAGVGGLGGGLMRRGALNRFVDDAAVQAAHPGLTRQNVGQALSTPEAFQKVTGGGQQAFDAAQKSLDAQIMTAPNFWNSAMTLGGAGFAGATMGGASNPYYRYGYSPYGY